MFFPGSVVASILKVAPVDKSWSACLLNLHLDKVQNFFSLSNCSMKHSFCTEGVCGTPPFLWPIHAIFPPFMPQRWILQVSVSLLPCLTQKAVWGVRSKGLFFLNFLMCQKGHAGAGEPDHLKPGTQGLGHRREAAA